jgi:prepilin-type N-terminal cleavage/methylation domain-containing protein
MITPRRLQRPGGSADDSALSICHASNRTTHAHQLAGTRRTAFTLVELLLVVVILAILAALVLPKFTAARTETRQTAFITSLRTFITAVHNYHADTGTYPADGATGQIADGFEKYVRDEQWIADTPIGGQWDTEYMDNGIGAGVGVHFMTGDKRDDTYMTQVDGRFDDGDLATGGFRKIATDRYYFIIQP